MSQIESPIIIPQHVVITINTAMWSNATPDNFTATFSLIERAIELRLQALSFYFYTPPARPHLHTITHTLFQTFIHALALNHLQGLNVKICFIGDDHHLEPDLLQQVQALQKQETDKSAFMLGLIYGYNGRADIAQAANRLVGTNQPLSDAVIATALEQHFYTHDLPTPDLLIYTGGERRLAHLLTWQASYAEFLFIDTDGLQLDGNRFYQTLLDFNLRQRRFGSG